ncbi:beta-carotene 15,15'-monooxygenase [Streptococcus oricebi]|uniref:Beta-carotene 15,15'-monooxygenase n=1 Tax=Streptococcus oricebi TaxID=1547447 RepID=A0ABS5B5Z6_9STRE|nr:beta-carotene 15,15'-monooxygenase [Streptococcus oricebi]MBP2623389.1 beta-carotene 15,15'-monooxygenase [Streptococcus oricebi]
MLKKLTNFIFQFGYFLILALAAILLFFLGLQIFFSHSYIPLEIAEGIRFENNPLIFYPLLLAFLGLLILSRFWLNKLTAPKLFIFLSLFYLLAAAYLIINSSGLIRADAKHVFNAALAFNRGDYSSLTTLGGYMYRNPHQLGLMSLERLYALISPTSQFIFSINLVWIILSNFLIYRITAKLNKDELVHKYTILLTFLFFPQFFFILFAYGTIPGFFFCLLGFYLLLLFNDKPSFHYGLLAAISLSIACLLRNNYIIFVLMVLGIYFLSLFQTWSFKKLLLLGTILACLFLSGKAINRYYEDLVGHTIGEGTPKIAYVTMGLRDDPNRKTLGGWYDAYNTKILKRNGYDEKKAEQMAIQDLKQLLLNFLKNPSYALRFFYEKVKSTWTEPTFQSIWTGPQLERQQYTATPLLRSIYEEKEGYQRLNLFGLVLLSSIYLLTSCFLLYQIFWAQKSLSVFELYPYVFFLGGFFFHFFWETKSQYVYIYILLLLPTAAQVLSLNKQKLTRQN